MSDNNQNEVEPEEMSCLELTIVSGSNLQPKDSNGLFSFQNKKEL